VQVLVANFDETLQADYLQIVSELRASGVNAMVYLETSDLKKQLAYASDKGIPQVLIYGPNEVATGEVIIKDLQTGEQKKIKKSELSVFCV
jgi:histidyl-tRNA synthetase